MSAQPHPEETTTGRRAGRPVEVVLVANANASGVRRNGGPERVAAELAALGGRVEVVLTHSIDEMAHLWRPEPGRLLVLLGGDGTLHSAVNLPGPSPEVALIPAGGANNVARCLGIPTDPAGAARVAMTGAASAIDLIECRSAAGRVVAVEGLSVGFLALARARYHASNSSDIPAAIAAGAAAAVHFHPLDVRLFEHGDPRVIHIGQLFVANMPCFGTHLRVAPHADPRDGLLDVVAVDIPGRRSIPAMLVRLRRGTHPGHPGVREWRAAGLRIETRGTSPVMADADDLGGGPVDVRVLPAALRIVVEGAGCT